MPCPLSCLAILGSNLSQDSLWRDRWPGCQESIGLEALTPFLPQAKCAFLDKSLYLPGIFFPYL